MVQIIWSIVLIGFGLLTISAFWCWAKALRESPLHGVGYLWQPFAIYYVITRWATMKVPFLLGILGLSLMILGWYLGCRHHLLSPQCCF